MRTTRAQSKVSKCGAVKLLHIVGDSNFGGGAIVIQRLAEMAQQMGWHVDVLATDPACRGLFRDHGIGEVNLDVIRREINPMRDLRGLFGLWQFLRRNDYDIVHTHTSKAGFVGRLAAKAARIPRIIHTAHGFPFHEESTRFELRIYSLLERIAAHACDRIITVSEFHRRWALELGIGDPEKVIAVPNGVGLNRVTPKRTRDVVRAELGINADTRLLLTTGRLADEKGIEYLLNALPDVKARLKVTFKLALVGTGPILTTLTRMVSALGLQDQVKFLGFRNDVGDLLGACDMVVLPTLHEGFSISLLEAMAAGKPIVTTRIGSNIEATYHGMAAKIVPVKDAVALAAAIVQLIKDPPLAEHKARNAKEIFERHYIEDRMLCGYRAIYSNLLQTPERNMQEVGALVQG